MKTVYYVTGGCRSGKSSYAEAIATKKYQKRYYIATAEAFDDEMKERIDHHQQSRGDAFTTIEAPVKLAEAIGSVDDSSAIILVDCLTVWLGNLIYKLPNFSEDCEPIQKLKEILINPPCSIILVSNELGMGVVPEYPEVRKFRDIAGRLNQRVATLADECYMVVSGMPVKIKPHENDV